MHLFGLKLWSINENYIDIAKKLYDENVYDYIELYAYPSSSNYIPLWKALDIPYIIHAPHFMQGVNLSIKDNFYKNVELINEARNYADKLNASKIIIHPGIKGDYKETARQINLIKDERFIIENKPYNVAVVSSNLNADDICVGHSPKEIKYIINETGIGFCLDLGHGICASNSLGVNYLDFLKEFLELSPYMFHISDGDTRGRIDKHYNIEQGNFDFNELFSLIPDNKMISVETNKASKDNLDDFVVDIKLLKEYSRGEIG